MSRKMKLHDLHSLFKDFRGTFSIPTLIKDVSMGWKSKEDFVGDLIGLIFLSICMWALLLRVFIVNVGKWPVSGVTTFICIVSHLLGLSISVLSQIPTDCSGETA